ncbi:triple gene block protein 3 [Potato latent virus]|uniref:Movement protein TGBp3 n=1 Tax=Potato latent virus TaxID=138982 RepID=Q1M2R4_9VIRU|nr:triple gene block protein 3 [Potato latent virus]ABF06658.1 7K protein [Potato latent virus]ACJ14321.1 triple gene block protein 3 [Potato latent virus]QNN81557.1 TGB3 [Potato latent virus]QPD01720.1 TGB3 [Potato latent virus]WIW79791.1 triple gene block protein 3 [Potato latent virus]
MSLTAIYLAIGLLVFSVSVYLIQPNLQDSCSIVITGESVRILNCRVTEALLRFALEAEPKSVKIP